MKPNSPVYLSLDPPMLLFLHIALLTLPRFPSSLKFTLTLPHSSPLTAMWTEFVYSIKKPRQFPNGSTAPASKEQNRESSLPKELTSKTRLPKHFTWTCAELSVPVGTWACSFGYPLHCSSSFGLELLGVGKVQKAGDQMVLLHQSPQARRVRGQATAMDNRPWR